jgi:AcrR family transcriptional regulator
VATKEASTRRKASPSAPAPAEADKSLRDKPYHHGSLPHALLEAAELVLRRDGMRGLTLRAIAREAGVSHTAPQHHFGDTAGVLSELAASGHRRLAQCMADSAAGAQPGKPQRRAIARGYVRFAVDNPDLLRLMTRSELLDATRPALIEARRASGQALTGVFNEVSEPAAADARTFGKIDAAQAIKLTAGWAYVHGLAMLLIDGSLKGLVASAAGIGDAEALVDAAIEQGISLLAIDGQDAGPGASM